MSDHWYDVGFQEAKEGKPCDPWRFGIGLSQRMDYYRGYSDSGHEVLDGISRSITETAIGLLKVRRPTSFLATMSKEDLEEAGQLEELIMGKHGGWLLHPDMKGDGK